MSDHGGQIEATSSSVGPRARRLGDLLDYLPDYGLVICKPCAFAVQPKAIPSHLLRHHVYREKRQSLLDRVAELQLLDPTLVPLPEPRAPAIPFLPVTTGYRCTLPTCNHLCISHKRMSQHLREQHGHANGTEVNNRVDKVYLQTFFRGNKVRYFEVEPMREKPSNCSESRHDNFRFVNESIPNQSVWPGIPTGISDTASLHKEHEAQLPMENLLYLHHYITVTASSLVRGTESVNFWTDKIPLEAGRLPFLMHGILGAAAFHQAVLALNQNDCIRHQSAGLHHQTRGLATFRGIVDHPTRETSTALTTFARLLGVQICAQALLGARGHSSHARGVNDTEIFEVLECMQLLRGGLELLLGMQKLLPVNSELLLSDEVLEGLQDLEFAPEMLKGSAPYIANELFSRLTSSEALLHSKRPCRLQTLTDVKQFLILCSTVSETPTTESITENWLASAASGNFQCPGDSRTFTKLVRQSRNAGEDKYRQNLLSNVAAPSPILSCYPNIPATIYEKLLTIPARLMAEINEASSIDINASDHAMAALISSFSRSYAADSVWARWNGIESWPRMLPENFVTMIRNTHPLALVLVAHWLYLLSMQEKHYWFLEGRPQRMLGIVLRNLNHDLRTFVQESLASFDVTD
ncbi:hypothetical protein H2200_009740 [Cladophialophora chaetospira]|uniref:C2H2-type domain-containing protein n=1 Tax=Cladophialophora chaetospira TaxID=386627 RepID=A0AA38X303_9EURO|nr:hypothetical protein H2200_009740 [Cladophialophora chaetospira]